MPLRFRRAMVRVGLWTIFSLIIILSLLPLAVRQGAIWWLGEQGIEAEFKHIDLALLPGRISLQGVAWQDQGEAQFALDELLVDWHWGSLLAGNPRIEQFSIRGLRIASRVEQLASGEMAMSVAGFALPAGEQQTEPEPPKSASDTAGQSAKLLRVSVESFALQDWQLCNQSRWLDGPEALNLCVGWQSLTLPKGVVFEQDSALKLTLPALLWQGLALVDGSPAKSEQPPIMALSQLRLGDFSLVDQQWSLAELALGELQLSRPDYAFLPPMPARAGWQNMSLAGLMMNTASTQVQFEHWRLDGLQIAEADQADAAIERDLLTLQAVQVREFQGSPDKAVLQALELNELVAIAEPIDEYTQQQILIEAPHVKNLDRMLEISALTLSGISLALTDALYEIDALQLSGPKVLLVKNQSGDWAWQPIVDRYLPASKNSPDAQNSASAQSSTEAQPNDPQAAPPTDPPTQLPTEPPSPVNFRVGQISIDGDNQWLFFDAELEPPLTLAVSQLDFSLGAIDSRAPGQPTPVSINAQIGEFGQVELVGNAAPLSQPLNMQLTGRVSDMALHPTSPYLRQFIGQRIKTGQLSNDLAITVVDDQLDALIDIKLHKLQLTGKPAAHESDEQASELLPIGVALNLLRDGNDRIRLKLPVKGDVHDPSISPNQILGVVLRKALTEAVLQYYSPFGLVSLARFTIGQATKLRFKPLLFEAGSSEFSADTQARLQELPPLLAKRPNVTMTFCAHVNGADHQALMAQFKEASSEEQQRQQEEQLNQQLRALAKARGSAIKRYLVEQGVGGEQVALCEPELDLDDQNTPQVDVAI